MASFSNLPPELILEIASWLPFHAGTRKISGIPRLPRTGIAVAL